MVNRVLLDLATPIRTFDVAKERGRQEQARNVLSRFLPAALQGDEAALDQLLQTSPQAGLQVRGLLGQERERIESREARTAERAESRAFRQSQADESKRRFDQEFGLRQRQFASNQQFRDTQIKKLETDIAKAAQPEAPDPELTQKLRKEFTTLSKDFIKVRDATGRIRASAENPSPAGDLALIFNFMKVLDPGSTVREGEFATAQNSGNVTSKIIAQYNRVLNGERLSDTQRQDFVSRAEGLFDQQSKQHQSLTKVFDRLATKAGIDPDDVAIELGIAGPEQQPAQTETQGAAGNVVQGTTSSGVQFKFTPGG